MENKTEEKQESLKHRLFYGSLGLHQAVARKFGGEVRFIPKGHLDETKVVTQHMAYDNVSKTMAPEYACQWDYVRYRTIELIAEEIHRNKTEGDVAEAGVDYGDCSWIINGAFSDRTMYLYDTFRGFDKRDVEKETEHNYTSEAFYQSANYFLREQFKTAEDQIAYVKSRLPHPENAFFRAGYFPETAEGEKENRFAFVSLDMDLYQPILNGILFFWPRLNDGGYIMIHDYNHREFKGIKDAIAEAEKSLGKLPKMPLPDQGGTIVLIKP